MAEHQSGLETRSNRRVLSTRLRALAVCAVIAGCAGGAGNKGSSEDGDGGGSGGAGSGSAGSGSTGSGAGGGSGTSSGITDGAVSDAAMTPGNPYGSCKAGVPAGGAPADVSQPTTVVGDGTPDSCTFQALSAAVTKGGVITFDCGSAPITIPVTSTLDVPTTKNTVIDGGGLVTLDGGHAVRIFYFYSANFQANENRLTLQHLTVVNGKTTPTERIPDAAPPCSQGWDDGEGGAIDMRDGNLTIIDCVFSGNEAAQLGPDVGGGAIYVLGSKHGALIVGSTFTNNSAANGGAVGGLFCELDVYDSLFTGNTATGNGANNNNQAECPDAMNAGQYEVGSGGNGGALYSDGNSVNIVLCGDAIEDNAAGTNAFGGGVFFTSDNWAGTLSITDSTITGNTGGAWTNVKSGSVTSAGSAVGTNAQSITITNSTVQGVK